MRIMKEAGLRDRERARGLAAGEPERRREPVNARAWDRAISTHGTDMTQLCVTVIRQEIDGPEARRQLGEISGKIRATYRGLLAGGQA
jgi:hypothetical protein